MKYEAPKAVRLSEAATAAGQCVTGMEYETPPTGACYTGSAVNPGYPCTDGLGVTS